MGLSQVGIDGQRLAKITDGPVRVAQKPPGVGQVIARHGEDGVETQGCLEGIPGGFGLAQFQEGQAEVIGGFSLVGVQAQRRPTAADGPVELSQGPIRLGEVGVEGCRAGAQPDGAVDQFHGPGRISLLMSNHSQQVQSIRLVRVLGQDALVNLRCFVQCPLLVQGDRFLQGRNGNRQATSPRLGCGYSRQGQLEGVPTAANY